MMTRLLSLHATLFNLCTVKAITFSLSRPFLSEVPPIKALEPRQAPGVIASSDFLRRGYQASVVAGDWLYVDGGEFSFMSNGTPQFEYASTLLSIDLTQNWTNATVAIQSNTKPDSAPNLNNPSLWYHASENLIYSGFTGWNSSFGNDPDLPALSLWTLKPDGSGSGTWNETISAESPVWFQVTRPAQPLMAFDSNSAWVLGGKLSDSIWSASPENLIPGMVQFDMTSRSFSNSSVQCCNATGGIYRGALQYVPTFGPGGIFIAMGGQNGIGTWGMNADLNDFGTISVFDPAKQEWWNQTTTGSEPSPRVGFCTAGVESINGTYEIFVYAGWGTTLGPAAVQYDTINILTLPAFHWISVPYNPENPRYGHSCNAVGGSQILTIGGIDSNPQDANGVNQIESTFDTLPDPFAQGLAIFDMTALAFSDQYTAGAPSYEHSEVVKQFYSQSAGAYMNNLTPQVSALLKTTHFVNSCPLLSLYYGLGPWETADYYPASSNTSSNVSGSSNAPVNSSNSAGAPQTSSKSKTSESTRLKSGAIAGIAVGAAVAFCISAAGIAYLLRRRTTSQKSDVSRGSESIHEVGWPLELQGQWVPELEQPASSVEVHGQNIQELEHAASSVEIHGQSIQELEHAASKTKVRTQKLQELEQPGFPPEM